MRVIRSFMAIIVTIISLFNLSNVSYAEEINVKDAFDLENTKKVYSVNVVVNDEDIKDSVPAVLFDNRTLVPIRAVAESIGFIVNWVPETHTVIIEKDGHKVEIQIDNPVAIVDGNDKNMYDNVSAKLLLFEGEEYANTMVPLRFIMEELGLNVYYNNSPRTAFLSTKSTSYKVDYISKLDNSHDVYINKTIGAINYSNYKNGNNENVIDISFGDDFVDQDISVYENAVKISTAQMRNNILSINVGNMKNPSAVKEQNKIVIKEGDDSNDIIETQVTNNINNIQIGKNNVNTYVALTTTSKAAYTTIDLGDRLVIDFESSINNLSPRNYSVGSKIIEGIRSSQFESMQNNGKNTTRLVFDLISSTDKLEYETDIYDNMFIATFGDYSKEAYIDTVTFNKELEYEQLVFDAVGTVSYKIFTDGNSIVLRVLNKTHNINSKDINSEVIKSIDTNSNSPYWTDIKINLASPAFDYNYNAKYENGMIKLSVATTKKANLIVDKSGIQSTVSLKSDEYKISDVSASGNKVNFTVNVDNLSPGKIVVKDGIIQNVIISDNGDGYKGTITLANGANYVSATDQQIILKNDVLNISNNPKYTIIIDPGHGGYDSGAVVDNATIKEKDINLSVSLKLRDKLVADNYNVIMTRYEDDYLSLYPRAEIANDNNGDAFISIHSNSASNTEASGLEGINDGTAVKKEFANIILNSTSNVTGTPIRRMITNNEFVVTREANMPAVLIELGFMTNEQEKEKLLTDSYKDLLANGIKTGINKYFD